MWLEGQWNAECGISHKNTYTELHLFIHSFICCVVCLVASSSFQMSVPSLFHTVSGDMM
jgi:hypothetical protein